MYDSFILNTPSHALIGAALRKGYGERWAVPLSAVLWGSVAPDIPLYLLSVGGGIYYTQIMGMGAADAARLMFDDLFFNDTGWKAAHNFLHAPLIVLTGLGLTWRSRGRGGLSTSTADIDTEIDTETNAEGTNRVGRWLFWFFAACLLHSVIDILTHHNDGPLILFPLNWSLRFHSPVSYWDPAYYGTPFTIFEITLDIVLLFYLLVPPARRWFAKKRSRPQQSG